MEFRDAVKYLRSELGLTQVELATGLNMNALTIGRWENGKTFPTRSITAVLLEYARTRGASKKCLDILTAAINAAAKGKLEFTGEGLYAVEHASLRQLIDDASFPIYVCDMETDELLYLNQKACAMVGSETSAVGRKCYECLMHLDAPCDFCHKDKLVEGRFISYDAYRPFDNVTYHVQGKRIQWNGHRAQVRYVLGQGRTAEQPFGGDSIAAKDSGAELPARGDTAMTKLIQQSIENERSKEQLKAIFENINGGVSVVAFGGDDKVFLAYANDRYYELFGYTKQQFAAELKDPHQTLYPADVEYVGAAITRIKQTRQAETFQYRVVRRDQSIAYLRCNASVSSIAGLSDKVMISVLTDVTASVKAEQQAVVTGHRLDAIMKNMVSAVTASIVHSDGSVNILFSNDRYHEILGFTREQYQSEVPDPFRLIHPDDVKALQSSLMELRKPGDAKELKYRIITRDGHTKWINVRISIMTFPDAQEPVQLSVYTDITDMVEATEQLAAQHDQIVDLLNDTPSGIAIIELDPRDPLGTLNTKYYNDRFYQFSGYGRDEYEAHFKENQLFFVLEEDVPKLVKDTVEICKSDIGTCADTLVRCHTKDGGYRWLLLTGQLVQRRGELCVLHIALVDVTERQEAIDRQRISEEMLRIAAETDKRAMIVYDVKNNVCRVESRTLFSAKYGETFGNVPDSLIDRGIAAPDSVDELCALFARIRNGEAEIRISLELRVDTNKYEWFECNAATVLDAAGRPDHAVLVFHNITEQRVKEAVFKKWQQSIDTRPPESYTLFRCNLSKDASLDQRDGELLKIKFTSDVLSFNGRTKRYAEEYVCPDDRDAYTALLDSDTLLAMFYRGEHSAVLEYRETGENGEDVWRRLTVEMVEYLNSTDIQAFLMYEDIDEAKKAEIEQREIAETDSLTGALNRAAFAEKVDTTIRTDPAVQNALIMLDMDGFKALNDTFGHAAGDQALQEVVAVLRSYTRSGDLVCRLGGDEFLVWLRDIPYDAVIGKTVQQMCEHIRKAYSQEVLLSASAGIAVYPRDGHSYDELYPNADRALYKVKQAEKGSYAFYSVTGEAETPEIARAVSAVQQAPTPSRGSKRRLLIVDDNETSRVMLKNIFKDAYLIELAKNGAEAMMRLRHFGASVSVVLLDLVMPGIDGFEVLRKMQRNTELRTIPVIVVTGDEERSTLLKAIELGAAEYVQKPIDVDLIRMRVQSIISKAENERLRAQNSYLMLQRDEEAKYRTVLESTGTVLVEYDWRNHVFIYDGEISKHIAGSFDHRGLWQVLLSDMVAESADVKTMQDTLIALAGSRDEKQDSRLIKLKTPEGEKHWFRMMLYKREDDLGLAEKIIITFNDVDKEVRSNDKLLFQATRDELTGLYSRAGFLEKAAELIAKKQPGYYVMACIDIEKFKVINDQYGTAKGDEILRKFAGALENLHSGDNGICCRVTADNFAVLYPAKMIGSPELERSHFAVEHLDETIPVIQFAAGRCLVDDKSLPVSAIYDRAVIAKSTIKGRFDTHIATFDESMRTAILRQQEITGQMNEALESGQFEVWLQPQFNHSTGMLSGAEALVRWRHPVEGIISPAEFIPIFERNGFVYEVDKYVWEQTCILLRKWLDQGLHPVPVSVNISRYDVFRDDLISIIEGLVKEYDLPRDLLCLEITESAFSKSSDQIIKVVQTLVDAGFTVEIDDFGSGYSSLNTLKDVPAQILKMDMRFLENDTNAQRGGSIIESVVRMAKWLGMSVIAEGVETIEQADYLTSIGCEYIQGYLYSRPQQAMEYEKLFADGKIESKLGALKTVETWNNNAFWNPTSMETLIFNSYVGGACIFEYKDGKTELLRYNAEYAALFGGNFKYDHSDAHNNILSVLDEENAATFRACLAAAIEAKKEVSCEIELRGNHQEIFMFIRMTVRQIAQAGERHLFYCVVSDNTDQRVAEMKAQEASERVSAVMDYSHCGISAVIAHPDGKVDYIFANNRFYEILGYTKEQYEAEVESPFDCVYPEDRDKVFDTVTQLTKIGDTASLRMRDIRRDGSIIWLRCDMSIVRFVNIAQPVQMSSFIDITEQMENEMKQMESARQLEVIMSNVNGGVSAIQIRPDRTSTIIFNNDRYYALYGYTREEAEAEQLDIMSLILPEDIDGVMAKVNQLKRDGQSTYIDYGIQKKDGSRALLRANSSLMSIPGCGDDVITSVITDITEKKSLEDKLSAIIANINGGVSAVYLKSDRPEYVISNDQYYELVGYTKEEYQSKHINPFDLVHPDDLDWVQRKFMEARKTGERYSMEYRIVLRDGCIRHILCNTSVIHLFGIEEPVQLAVSSDITEMREAERKQLALSVQLQTIMDNIHGGVTATVYHDKDNVEVIFSNDGFYEMYGYTKQQLEAEVPNMLDLIYAEDREQTMETVARIVRERGSETYEYRCHKRDGGTVWIQCTNSVISLDGIGDTVLLAVTTDITALREAQQGQLATADRLRKVMNAMQNGMTAVAFYDDGMKFLFANNRYYEIHGIHRGDIGEEHLSSVLNLVIPEDRALMRETVHSALQTGKSATAEYRICRPDGTMRWMSAAINMTELVGIDAPVQVTIFTDITEIKRASSQLRFLNTTAGSILAAADVNVAIRDTLHGIMDYFSADRAYVVELDYERGVSNNTYEVCADGVSAEMDKLQNLPFGPTDFWYDTLCRHQFFIIEDVAAMDESHAELRKMLLDQNIGSIVLAPLWRERQLIGFLGADNPKQAIDQITQLTGLADYVSLSLSRRDLNRKVAHDMSAIETLMNDTPGGFLRMAVRPGKSPAIVSLNDGMCRMLSMTRDEVMSDYGDDAHRLFTPEEIEETAQKVRSALECMGQYDCQCTLHCKGGKNLPVMAIGRFVQDEKGDVFLNAYFTDITDKMAETQRQKALLDNLPTGAAMYEFDGEKLTVVHINRQYWKLVERSPVEYGSASVTDAIHPDDRLGVIQEIAAAIRQKRNAEADARILCGEGNYKPFRLTANITPEENGKHLLFVSYAPIDSETMSIQELLPIALSTITANTDDMSYVKDQDLRYICVSRSIAEMAGAQSPRDLIGKTAGEVFSETFSDKFNEDDRDIIETGVSRTNVLEHIPMADGGVRLARTSKFPILDARGKAVGVFCTSHDVTAQRETESRLALLTGSIPGGLASYAVTAAGFKTLYFNDGYYDFSGYTREEYVERNEKEPFFLIVPEDRPIFRAMISSLMADRRDGDTAHCEFRCRTKDGAVKWMSLKAVLNIVGAENCVINAVQLDVTEQKEAENKQAALLDNLPFGAAMYRFDGKTLTALHINKQYEKMVNRQQTSATTDLLPMDYIHPDDRKVVFDEVVDAIAMNRNGCCDVRLLYGEREYRTFHIDAQIAKQPDGSYLLYVAYSYITEQEMSFKNTLPFIFNTIMENSTDLAFAKDVNFRYTCCSKTFVELLGLGSEKDVVGKTDYELFPRKIAEQFHHDDSNLYATEKPHIDVTEILPSPDGTLHYTRTSKHLLRDTQGNAVGIYGVGRDITDDKEAYARLKLLAESIPGGLATFTVKSMSENHLDYYNEGFRYLSGHSAEEFARFSSDPMALVFEDDRQIVIPQAKALIRNGTPMNCIFRIHADNGRFLWVSFKAAVADRYQDSRIVNCVVMDVTEQQLEKERLAQREEEYRLATEHSKRTICRYNIADSTVAVSAEVAKRLSLPEIVEDVPYGRVKLGVVSPDTADAYIAFYEAIRRGEKESAVVFRKHLVTGWRWISAHATTTFNAEGEAVSAIISFVDVTDQQEKEAVYKKWQQSLKDRKEDTYTLYQTNLNKNGAADTKEGMLLDYFPTEDDVKSLTERARDFAAKYVFEGDREQYLTFMNADAMLAAYYRGKRTDSLEFRIMLSTGVLRWLRLTVELVEYPNSTDVEAYLLFEDIHDSKLQALQTKLMAETDPLTGLLNRKTFIMRMDEMLAKRKGKALYALFLIDLDGFKLINDSFGHAIGDKVLVDTAQVIRSVLRENDLVCRMGGDEFLICLAAVPDRDVIEKKARQILDLIHTIFHLEVKMSISIGIAVCPEDGNTFEKLYPKVDRALYHVKSHGKDNCVFYDDRMKSAILDADAFARTPIEPKEKQKILVVDDSTVNRKLLSNVFADDFEPVTVGDGFSAMQYIRKNAADIAVILLDPVMPDMDGFAVLEQLRENEDTAAIPVVVVSGMDERDATLRVIKAGASDYVTKPVDPTLLRIRVDSAIAKAENDRLRAQNRYLSLLKVQADRSGEE